MISVLIYRLGRFEETRDLATIQFERTFLRYWEDLIDRKRPRLGTRVW